MKKEEKTASTYSTQDDIKNQKIDSNKVDSLSTNSKLQPESISPPVKEEKQQAAFTLKPVADSSSLCSVGPSKSPGPGKA
ncbi:hypothetical protein [Sunxiuqinia elliptica]|uniref:hypothetical protein n=1 Tax=Sunxiuqinia elliptica TaxID=655355 RepID=UPI001113C415|nr:hypothetical protein [Sunxiuqinia elliptica]